MTQSFDMRDAKHGPEESGPGMITPDKDRYARMPYRRTGRSGLKLPAVSLGLWQNFGGERPIETQRAIIRRAFDLGITHFDLANNYGPPYGSAEESFGHVLRSDLSRHRDELVISTGTPPKVGSTSGQRRAQGKEPS